LLFDKLLFIILGFLFNISQHLFELKYIIGQSIEYYIVVKNILIKRLWVRVCVSHIILFWIFSFLAISLSLLFILGWIHTCTIELLLFKIVVFKYRFMLPFSKIVGRLGLRFIFHPPNYIKCSTYLKSKFYSINRNIS
jgi:hypothetical protein